MPRIERIGDNGNGMGARVRSARNTLDLTITDVAAEVGVTPRAISQLEGGDTKKPSVFLMLRLSRSLGVSVDYLAFGVGDSTVKRVRPRKRPRDEREEQFGERVGRMREENGFTFDDLASLSGINESAVRSYESGAVKSASFPVGVRLADALGVDARWLALGTHSHTAERFEAIEERLTVVERTVPGRMPA